MIPKRAGSSSHNHKDPPHTGSAAQRSPPTTFHGYHINWRIALELTDPKLNNHIHLIKTNATTTSLGICYCTTTIGNHWQPSHPRSCFHLGVHSHGLSTCTHGFHQVWKEINLYSAVQNTDTLYVCKVYTVKSHIQVSPLFWIANTELDKADSTAEKRWNPFAYFPRSPLYNDLHTIFGANKALTNCLA